MANNYPESYADAINPRCKPIGKDYRPKKYDHSSARRHHLDPTPDDPLKRSWHYGPNGELLAPGEPDPPIIPEEVDD